MAEGSFSCLVQPVEEAETSRCSPAVCACESGFARPDSRWRTAAGVGERPSVSTTGLMWRQDGSQRASHSFLNIQQVLHKDKKQHEMSRQSSNTPPTGTNVRSSVWQEDAHYPKNMFDQQLLNKKYMKHIHLPSSFSVLLTLYWFQDTVDQYSEIYPQESAVVESEYIYSSIVLKYSFQVLVLYSQSQETFHDRTSTFTADT